MYKKMHREGYEKKDGGFIEKENSFNGISTIPYAPIIKKIIDRNNLIMVVAKQNFMKKNLH